MIYKRIAAIFLIASLSLSACGKSTEAVNENTEEQTKEAAADIAAANESPKPDEKTDAKYPSFTIVEHRMESEEILDTEESSFPYGYVTYQTIELSDDTKEKYPKLSAAMEERSKENEEYALSILADAVGTCVYAYNLDWMYTSNQETCETEIKCADNKILSVLETFDYYFNGPHPTMYYGSYAYDVQTGEGIPLSDVIADIKALPKIILDNLETVSEDYEFTEEENAEMLEKLEGYVAEGGLVWTLDDEAFNVYFDAYALQYYAFGPMFATLELKEYPDLIVPEYRPEKADVSIENRVKYEDAGTVKYSWETLKEYSTEDNYEVQGDGDNAGLYDVWNPGWDYYVDSSVNNPIKETPITLEKRKQEAITFPENWAYENNETLPVTVYQNPYYTDNEYKYLVENELEGYLAVTVYDAATDTEIGTFNFSQYLYPPDTDYKNSFSDVTDTEIIAAQAFKGVLYVAIGHRTYAAAQPHKAYIVAIDLASKKVLWRSNDLISSAYDIIITKDYLITGYGFTYEDDFVYIINAHTGAIMDTYPVDSAPYYLLYRGDTLYVLTYSSAYTYKIVKK